MKQKSLSFDENDYIMGEWVRSWTFVHSTAVRHLIHVVRTCFNLQDPPAEEGLYDIRVVAVCSKRGGFTKSSTPVITGRVGDNAPKTSASVAMADVVKGEGKSAPSASALKASIDSKVDNMDKQLSAKIDKLTAMLLEATPANSKV